MKFYLQWQWHGTIKQCINLRCNLKKPESHYSQSSRSQKNLTLSYSSSVASFLSSKIYELGKTIIIISAQRKGYLEFPKNCKFRMSLIVVYPKLSVTVREIYRIFLQIYLRRCIPNNTITYQERIEKIQARGTPATKFLI